MLTPEDAHCAKCGQRHRRCGAHNRGGMPCGRMAMKHLTVCDRHGGKAPNARRSADKRSIAAMFEANPLATYIAAESNLKRLIVALTVELGRYTEMLNRMEGAASQGNLDPATIRKANAYDDLKALGILEQMGITE